MVTRFVRALPLSLITLAAACGGGTDSKTRSVGGDYVLTAVDGENVPTEVASGLGATESLISGRMEFVADSARDIKERRRSTFGQPTTTITDTVWLKVTRVSERTLLLRPTYAPTLQPDTATLADGVAEDALLSVRTRSAPSTFSAFRRTLSYSRQR